jgi:TetR/AcrR family transcriptional regulator, cholesterol catabolism regulator
LGIGDTVSQIPKECALPQRNVHNSKRRPALERADEIIAVVIDILERDGYDAVQVRTVADTAKISLATLYKLFSTRDELIVSAIERWMDASVYVKVAPPSPAEDPYEAMVRVVRTVFSPWEDQPRMLEAFHRASYRPGGERLHAQGLPIVEDFVQGVDSEYARDLQLIMWHMVRSVLDRFAEGELAITKIVPVLERTLFRLTADNRSSFLLLSSADVSESVEDTALR